MRLKILKILFLTPLFLLIGTIVQAQERRPIKEIERYFPDEIGRTWTYMGSVSDEVQRVASYKNIATVRGTAEKSGIEITVFTETNQANRGPSESYFSKDKNGIVYHGGEPTTAFEGQLVPYRVVRFPMKLHQSFSQIEKRNVSFGLDLDHDGKEEEADVSAVLIAERFETISVPAGVFEDCLRMNGTMVIRITLSGNKQVVQLIDRTTNWFAHDIGMVKGIESIMFPAIGELPATGSIITEELSEYSQETISLH